MQRDLFQFPVLDKLCSVSIPTCSSNFVYVPLRTGIGEEVSVWLQALLCRMSLVACSKNTVVANDIGALSLKVVNVEGENNCWGLPTVKSCH